ARCSMVTPTGGVRVRRDDAGMSHAEDHFADAEPEKEKSAADGGMNGVKPSEVYEYLSGCIVSQDAAKRCASMIMYDHFSGRRSVCVFAGPTGSGKTEIFRLLQKKYPEDVRIVDASRLTAEGYRGSFHLRDIFEGISPGRIAEKGLVVVLDEADKLFCETHIGSAGTDYSAMIQGQLLRMMDGDRLEFSSDMVSKEDLAVDCSKVSVVLLGAFEKLLSVRSAGKGQSLGFTGTGRRGTEDYSTVKLSHSDLIKAGMRTEIAGRIERIVQLTPLSGKDMEDILKKSVIPSFERELGIHISLAGESAGFLARRAVENSLVVRYLRSAVNNALDELIFEDPGRSECVIDLCA
ncbi:MAG: AAA family ATPase, partial [Eubacteriaceae bacterium]|nr:AAA family ATPase [Eubacteriaceae bacterium]